MIREATEKDKKTFDQAATHPLQSWQWGQFRKLTGVEVLRLVEEENGKIKNVFQITWHKIPKTRLYIGYCPKSTIPSEKTLEAMEAIARKKKAIMVKFEPNEKALPEVKERLDLLKNKFPLKDGKPLFTKYTFQLDISKSEDDLLRNMHQKTRYNIRLAEKKGVRIVEDNTEAGFEEYWKLTEETTKRQRFFSHTKNYHRKMFHTVVLKEGGHLLKAVYEGKILTTWILFELGDVLYYPYGASSNEHREVMANNLMMWEAIKLGKKNKRKTFDMWGSLGPVPDEKDPWYGFHRFKQGYGGVLTEFVGTYDLVIFPTLYKIYLALDVLRWIGLKILTRFR